MIEVFLYILFSYFIFALIYLYLKRPKYKYYTSNDNGWLDINAHPIPEDFDDELMISDGNNVKTLFAVQYNSKGQLVYSSYRKTLVTHWMPLPKPPILK